MLTIYIIKIGGNVIDDEAKLKKFLADFSLIKENKILIHGGGKIATEISKKLGIETRMVEGRRITDAETLKVVTMVYAGLINKNIVATLQSQNCNAIGLCGADANILPAVKRVHPTIDFGFVGDVSENEIKAKPIQALLGSGLTPVIAPLTHDKKGSLLNTNADTIASSIAVSLAMEADVSLVYCFEKKGVLHDPSNENSVIPEINFNSYQKFKADGIISEGMIPKLDNAFSAIKKGVKKVIICQADTLKDAIRTGTNTGTILLNN